MKLAIALCSLLASVAAAAETEPVKWEKWSPAVLTRAAREHRFVLLDLEAVWCHWCHVQAETSYRDPAVVALLGEHFVAVRADQDADPDLVSRYEEWGWPATIVFAPDGSELVKRRGYLAPAKLAALLQAIVDDPTPGPSVTAAAAWTPAADARLTAKQRAALERGFNELYDGEHGGWGRIHKFVDGDAVGYALARAGDPVATTARRRAARMARTTLDAALQLIDPVWGGMYQYSDSLDWKSPHFEKIMSIQANALRSYVRAYALWHDPRHLAAARAIAGYVQSFLTAPDGSFYTSQDADLSREVDGHAYFPLDDAARRRLGVPRVDTHVYPRDNGWMIAALAELGDPDALARASHAAERIIARFGVAGGGFKRSDDDARSYLADQVAMGDAFLALHRRTGDGAWLERARAVGGYIVERFAAGDGAGFVSAEAQAGASGVFATPARSVDENVAAARLFAALARPRDAAQALRYLSSPSVVDGRFLPGLLLADAELRREGASRISGPSRAVEPQADRGATTAHTGGM